MIRPLLSLLMVPSFALAQAPAPPPAEQLAPLARFIGGQWVVDGKWSDGRPLRARDVLEWGVNRATIHAKTLSPGTRASTSVTRTPLRGMRGRSACSWWTLPS